MKNGDGEFGLTSGHETPLEVAYVATLARLKLSTEETQLFQAQLRDVIEHVEKLREVDLGEVEPATHVIPIFDVFRKDEVRPSLSPQDALRNAPRQANDLFTVTKVVE